MYLKELRIKNFRKIKDLTIQLPKGLCVLVGENNSGKTAIIDALRLMLFSGGNVYSLRLNRDDFRHGTDYKPIEISCVFADLLEDDEIHFQECLVDIGDGKFEAQLNMCAVFNEVTDRPNIKYWGGETEGGIISPTVYDQMETIYLQPLRDPESGLRPGRRSQIARLLDCLTTKDEQERYIEIANGANEEIHGLNSITQATDDINSQMRKIAGKKLTQNTRLVFSEPNFHRIISGIHPEIDNLPFSLNGLGYNNLIFTSATLSTLQKRDTFSYRSILVEEPEAHLHPQLQTLLLQHFANVADENNGKNLQVITSSHSPILASQAPIDSIISVHEADGDVQAVSICNIDIDRKLKKKLQRYLDATRGELFFARRILMVEGIAEALLLPVLAKIAGGDLKESAVTVVNADGINFNAFLPLFGSGKLEIPVTILTDADPQKDNPVSSTTQKLKAMASTISNLRVNFCEVTLEHELAKSSNLLRHMIKAFTTLHKNNGRKLATEIDEKNDDSKKADVFMDTFRKKGASKGRFAQELADLLEEDNELNREDVPDYILDAFKHLGVIEQ